MTTVNQDFEMVRSYLAVTGLGAPFFSAVHSEDEMYSYLISGLSNPPDRGLYSYFETGRNMWRTFQDTLRQAGRSVERIERLLELPCGYGRLTRHLVRDVDPARITTVDIQAAAIDFQTKSLGTHAVLSDTDPARVPLEPGFDLILVVSLFSHLPAHRFDQWLMRLHELLSPDGLMLFSVHPEHVLEPARRDPSGFTFEAARAERNAIASDDPDLDVQEYGSTFATPDAVKRIAERCGVRHTYLLPMGLAGTQDLYAVSRQAIPALEAWQPTPVLQGFVDYLRRGEPGEVCVEGWCVDTVGAARPERLRVWVDGVEVVGAFRLCEERADVASVASRPDWLRTGWSIRGPLQLAERDEHLVIAEIDGAVFDCGWRAVTTR